MTEREYAKVIRLLLSEADVEVIEALKARLGVRGSQDLIRLSLRELAAVKGCLPPTPAPSGFGYEDDEDDDESSAA